MTRIILIRHGQSEGNISPNFACRTDVPLTELGHAQAALAAEYLVKNEKIDVIYASPLQRAMNTVRPTAERLGLPVHPDPDLQEIDAGEWENLTYDVLKQRYAAGYAAWRNDTIHAYCDGGESCVDVYNRMVAAVGRLAEQHDGKTLLIGSHWTPIYTVVSHALLGRLDQLDEAHSPMNASIHILEYIDGTFRPVKLNITAHLKDLARKDENDI